MIRSTQRTRRSNITHFRLGTARTGKQLYINRIDKVEREKRFAELAEAAVTNAVKVHRLGAAEWQALRSKLVIYLLWHVFVCFGGGMFRIRLTKGRWISMFAQHV